MANILIRYIADFAGKENHIILWQMDGHNFPPKYRKGYNFIALEQQQESLLVLLLV